MRYNYNETIYGKRRFNHFKRYKVFKFFQSLLWYCGIAVHDRFHDECTKDFNCCVNIGRWNFIHIGSKNRFYDRELNRIKK